MSFNRFRHPEGTRLPALERNILKYRGFEMLLMLFYVEELREMIIGAVRASARWKYRDLPRIEPGTKNKFKVARTALVRDGILSQHESDEIVKLVDIRNFVAHELHKMTFDISRDTWARQVREVEEARYDYDALGKVKSFVDTLEKRMQSKNTLEKYLWTLFCSDRRRGHTAAR
jgi:hypothetical protein